jgi:hypothetical protein
MFDLPNEALRPEHVPGPDAPWHPTIAEFVLTFDGYEAMGTVSPSTPSEGARSGRRMDRSRATCSIFVPASSWSNDLSSIPAHARRLTALSWLISRQFVRRPARRLSGGPAFEQRDVRLD